MPQAKPSPARTRIRRTIGQLQGIERMLEEGRSCEEIITQLMAARASLEKLGVELLRDETTLCFVAGKTDRKRLKNLEQLTRVMFRAV